MAEKNFTKENAKIPGFTSWRAMWDRCTYRNHVAYHRYGGRGISVCERWKSFAVFIDDMGVRPSPSHSIERKNSDGNYEPSNCVWATRRTQARNTCKNVMMSFNGETLTATDWAHRVSIRASTILRRKRLGWTDEAALTTTSKPRPEQRVIRFCGKSQTLREWARELGIRPGTLMQRLDVYQWPIERALSTPARKKRKSRFAESNETVS